MVELSDESAGEPRSLAALVGTVLGERYEIGRVLGAGGMGAVFEGKDLRLGRLVAIKVMQPSYARDAEYTKRFLREAQTASQIRHRNVVVILDYGETKGGLVYSVMEFLVGQDLEQLLRAHPDQRLPWAQACGLLVQIASGLKAAHAQGVIHRDIKPANCFVTTEDDEPVVKVVDFGIAKLDDTKQTQQLTGTGNVMGTPSYTAPEMVLTMGPASPQSDVYSLGVVAYRMLTGTLPFTGKTAFEVMHRACLHPAPSLREQVGDLPAAVDELVLEMLAKAPPQRPADMEEVRQRLQVLGRRLGGVDAPVVDAGSSALSLGVDGSDSSGESSRTEVFDSGSREPSWAPMAGATEVVDVAALAKFIAQRTEMPDSGRLMEEPGATQPAVGEATLTREDPGATERPRTAGWRVAGAVVVAAALGGVGWSMMNGMAEEPSPSREAGPEAATAEPERAVAAAIVEAPEPEPVVIPASEVATGGGSTGIEEVEAVEAEAMEVEAVEVEPVEVEPAPEEVEPAVPPAPAVVDPPPKARAGPPSDGTLKKRLSKRIKAKCATTMADQKVTVTFLVTSDGEPSLLTATPKNAAGECAKQKIVGTKFRTRSGETPLQIIVE